MTAVAINRMEINIKNKGAYRLLYFASYLVIAILSPTI